VAEEKKVASLDVARAIVAIPQNRSSWNDHIVEGDYRNFIWTGDGDQVERWNELAGAGAGLEDAVQRVENGEDVFITYKGRTLQAPVVQDREDDTIQVHTLNLLVKADSEIRFCVDSYHSSDICFLPLPPKDWRALEQEFGAAAVAYRFMVLPDDLAAFWKAFNAKCEEVGERDYESEQPEPTEQDLGYQRIDEEVRALTASRPEVTQVVPFLAFGTHLSILLVADTDRNRDRVRADDVFVTRIVNLVQAQCAKHGMHFECLAFGSDEAIAQSENESEWLVGWMREGFCPQIRFKVPPYLSQFAPQPADVSEASSPPQARRHFSMRPGTMLIIAIVLLLALVFFSK
jgi:hypothetical protein